MLGSAELVTFVSVTDIDRAQAFYVDVFGWTVSDMAVAVDQLVAAGIRFEHFDGLDQGDRQVWATPGGDQVAWFKGPDGGAVVEPGLVGRDLEIAREGEGHPVVHLLDRREAQTAQLAGHEVDPESGNEDGGPLVDPAQRGIVEVIEVVMGQGDVVDVEPRVVDRFDGWVVPPRTPVARAEEPGIDDQPAALGLDENLSVPDDGKSHRRTP